MSEESRFKKTDIGMVPEDWGIKIFSDVLLEKPRNGLYKPKNFHGKGTKMVNMGELFAYDKIGDSDMELVELTDSEKQRFLLNNGDLVFARRSLVASGAGKCSLVVGSVERTFESSIIRARPDPNKANSEYLFYFFSSIVGKHLLDSILRQVAVAGITGSDLINLKIPLPSLQEQCRIATTLAVLDEKIALNQTINKTLETIGQVLFKRWFVDFEFPNEEGKPYKSSGGEMIYSEYLTKDIPEAWAVGAINDLCSSITNGGTPKRMESRYWNGNIAWFKTGELTDGPLIDSEEHITEEGLRNSACKLWNENTILIALYASPTVGRLGLLRTKATSNQACSGLVAKKEIGHSFLFYNLFFKKNELNNIAVGAAQQNISQQIVREAKTVIPPTSLLNSFNVLVDSLFDKQTELIRQNKTISQIRDALLPKLMSGKIRVPLPKENAEVQ